MPITSVVPEHFVIGPALVYYRDVGVNTPWTSVGVTLDDAIARIELTMADVQNALSGVDGPVRGLDVIRRIASGFEFTLPEMMGEKLGLAIPGARYTAAVSTVKSSGHLDTTLTAATAVGATTIPVTAITNGAVGDHIKIGTGDTAEFRTITAIDTLDISFRDPLRFAHANGEAVEEADGDNRSVIEMPTVRRLGEDAYKEWALVAESGVSEVTEWRLPIGLSATTTAEVTIGDDAIAGLRVRVDGRKNPADLTQSIVKVFAPAIA